MFDSPPVRQSTCPLQQSSGFARALKAVGTPVRHLPDGTLVLQRRWGPVKVHMLSRVTINDRKIEVMRNAGLRGPVIFSPEKPFDRTNSDAVPLVSPSHLATLDLTPDIEILRAGLYQKWRNRLKHAEKQKLRVTRQNMPHQPDHWLLAADAAQQMARRYRSWPPALNSAFACENPGDAKLFIAHLGRAPVAGLLVLRHGAGASYHIGHTRTAGRRTSAHCLLLWQAILWLKKKQTSYFELGFVDTEEGADLARFKLGTGANVRPLGGTWLWWPPLTKLMRPFGRMDHQMMHPS